MTSIHARIRRICGAFSVVALAPTATCLMLLALPTVASAQFSGLFNTGVDNSSVALVTGSADSHYTVLENGSAPAIVAAGFYTSGYIWQNVNGDPGHLTLTFRTTFTFLPGYNPLTATLQGKWYADNLGLDIIVNGTGSGQTNPGGTFNFILTSGFVVGVNTLDFVVKDLGAPGYLEVTDFVGTATAVSTVPEPATVVLMAAGLFGVAVVGARRKR